MSISLKKLLMSSLLYNVLTMTKNLTLDKVGIDCATLPFGPGGSMQPYYGLTDVVPNPPLTTPDTPTSGIPTICPVA